MGNRISISIAKNIADSLYGIFFGIPAARSRKEKYEADIKGSEADMMKVEAYERLLDFLKKAGFSKNEIKIILTEQITFRDQEGNMMKNLQVIDELVNLHRINFQITGYGDEYSDNDDISQNDS